MPSKKAAVTIFRDGAMCFVPVPFDPKAIFGKVRAPVKVTLNGYTYRSTIARMGGVTCVPLRKSNREAAGLSGGETMEVTFTLDTEPREVTLPDDFRQALAANAAAQKRWEELSYTHHREHVEAVENARRPETRQRRIAAALAMLTEPRVRRKS